MRLIVIAPSVGPAQQGELFQAALGHIGTQDPMNTVTEVDYTGEAIKIRQYLFPRG
ncbi:MAG: hypothetical protein WA476_02895 [Acidobacteriaceae bacterium]